jgi:DNA-binding transcriptional regulator YiaG
MKIYEKWTMTIDDGCEVVLFDGRNYIHYDVLHELCGSDSINQTNGTMTYNSSSLFIEINDEISNGINKDNLSRASLSRMLDIPIRTLEDWDAGKSTPPVWVERLVIEKLEDLFECPRVLSIPSKVLQ